MKMPDKAKLIIEGKTYEYPVIVGTEGEKAIDISSLRADSGYITMDNSFGNTGSCESSITFIDGDKGILRYRGIPIEELAAKSFFTETAYLVMYGSLPTKDQLHSFSERLNKSSLIHEDMLHFFTGYPKGAHPMAILTSVVASLSAFYPVKDNLDPAAEEVIIANLMSQIRTIAAFSYKKSIGEPIVYPSNKLKFVENFLTMMFASPVRDYNLDPDMVKALDLFFLLSADHEQNCSTSTVRMAGSSLANIYAVIGAGVSALWGRLHGGANQEVIEMLEHAPGHQDHAGEIHGGHEEQQGQVHGLRAPCLQELRPRGRQVIKRLCHKLLKKPGMTDPTFDIALEAGGLSPCRTIISSAANSIPMWISIRD